jgi:hypothetical protein
MDVHRNISGIGRIESLVAVVYLGITHRCHHYLANQVVENSHIINVYNCALSICLDLK